MCNNPVFRRLPYGTHEYVKSPCNGCLGCRMDSLQLWQSRCNSEYIKYRSAFVTFTYDDLHIQYNDNSLLPTLRKKEFHKYIDNIRHKVKKMPFMPYGCIKDFRFFGCGEYGDSFARPHYHVLFFGLDFIEMQNLFISTWKNGSIKSLPILQGGIRYVVDYMSKSYNGELAEVEFDDTNRERPFITTSKGLGFDFMYSHRDEISQNGTIKIGSRHVNVPIYYKNLFTKYNYDSICSREKVKHDSYLRSVAKMRELGFTDYDTFMRYEQKARELSLASKFPEYVPHYNNYESLGDGYIPPLMKYKMGPDKGSIGGFNVKSLLCS